MKNLSRRRFLQGSGAAVALTALNPALNAATIGGTERKRILTGSKMGAFYAEVVDGKLVGATPYEKDPHPNMVVEAWPDRVYSNTRVKYPYVREGFLKNGHKSDTSKRGKEKFVRVSWEKAYELCAKEIMRVQKSYGPDAVYGGSLGWSSAGAFNKHYNVLQRFLNLSGGFINKTGTYSYGAFSTIMPRIAGSTATLHRATAWESIVKHADNIIFWGADPYVTNNVEFQIAAHRYYGAMDELLKQKKKRKVKIININPVYTETANKLGAEQISIIPNTDVALMLAMANYMYKENLYDKGFMKKYTVGSQKFFDYISGKTDGIDKTPQWAEKITSVPAKEIIELTKLVLSGKTTFVGGWSLQRADHGEQPHWLMLTLSAMTGQVGKPGGGVNFGGNSAGYGMASTGVPGISSIPKKIDPKFKTKMPWINKKAKSIPVASIARMLKNPGAEYKWNGKNVKYPDIKMIWWVGGNPFHHHQDVNDLAQAWQKPETVIINEVFWTASARMADIILPACTPMERNDLQYVGRSRRESYLGMKKVIEPVGESQTDYHIFTGIAEKMGPDYKAAYTNGLDEMGWIEYLYNEARSKAKIKMPEFAEFWKKGIVEFELPEKAKEYVVMSDFVKDRRKNRLGTPSGKIEVFSKTIDGYKYKECAGHPTWYEPTEWLGSKKAKQYPFHMISPHPKHRLHSQMNNTWYRQVYEVMGREPILINAQDAKRKGIKNGDVVKVFNERGATLAGAVVSNTIRQNVVQLHEGAWYSPVDFKNGNTMCSHGHANTVTLDKPTSELANATSANTCLVDFEKYEGKLPAVKVFDLPELV